MQRNFSIFGWSSFRKQSRSISLLEKLPSITSHDHHTFSVHNEMTTPKGCHDAKDPTENLAASLVISFKSLDSVIIFLC